MPDTSSHLEPHLGSDVERGRRWAADCPATAHAFVESLDDRLTITGADGHHLQRVRRVQAGETVTAADGAGTWREYHVVEADAGEIELHAVGPSIVEPRLVPKLTIAFALTKGAQPEVVVRRLTELGVDAIRPITSARSQVRWRGDRAAESHRRLERVVREAASQCRRARLPELYQVGVLEGLVGHPGLVVGRRGAALVTELALEELPEEWLVVVGPEGGLTPKEEDALGGASLGVGPFVLRAETAAPALAAALATRRHAPSGRTPDAG